MCVPDSFLAWALHLHAPSLPNSGQGTVPEMETGWGGKYTNQALCNQEEQVLGYKREPSRKPDSNGHFGFSSFLALDQSSFLLPS